MPACLLSTSRVGASPSRCRRRRPSRDERSEAARINPNASGMMWRATVLTIFPEMFPGPLGASLAGKALAAGLWGLAAVGIRAHAPDRHRSVHDPPARGGPRV